VSISCSKSSTKILLYLWLIWKENMPKRNKLQGCFCQVFLIDGLQVLHNLQYSKFLRQFWSNSTSETSVRNYTSRCNISEDCLLGFKMRTRIWILQTRKSVCHPFLSAQQIFYIILHAVTDLYTFLGRFGLLLRIYAHDRSRLYWFPCYYHSKENKTNYVQTRKISYFTL
jgi:hypothetical protein